MWERIEPRLRDVARRAGVADVPTPVVAAACVLCALACVWATWRWWPRAESVDTGLVAGLSVTDMAAASDVATKGQGAQVSAPVAFVHVVGAVRHPGVYELPAGSRVADAVGAAGGMLPDAVASGINLARPVNDGEQIVVPDEDDPTPPSAVGGASGGLGSGTPAAAGGPVDINSADTMALETLPGVGPATAAKIIAEREANGPFVSIEDVGRVSGIGPKKLEQLAGTACVR